MFDVVEKPKLVERALLVAVQHLPRNGTVAAAVLAELGELVRTLGVVVAGSLSIPVRRPQSRFLIGSGKFCEVVDQARMRKCDCIVFDNDLTPGQQRNWETESGLCVIDRQEVILDIFAARARTREAVLQVELARMQYSLPRLKRAWLHLGRQRGGGVTQRGEGEAQLEIDQRLIRRRIAVLKRELAAVVRHRDIQRKGRMKVPVPAGAIVGYTNAGKSSLLNRLTGSTVVTEDKLFVTLDPTTRRMRLPTGQAIVLTDTVGFVRRLPHRLVDAFRATLEEAVNASFIIHVLDSTSPDVEEHAETTRGVLAELGAEPELLITAYNKIDLLDLRQRDELKTRLLGGSAPSCFISAHTGECIDHLIEILDDFLQRDVEYVELFIPHREYRVVAQFHQYGEIAVEESDHKGIWIRGHIPRRLVERFSPYRLVNGVRGLPPEIPRSKRETPDRKSSRFVDAEG